MVSEYLNSISSKEDWIQFINFVGPNYKPSKLFSEELLLKYLKEETEDKNWDNVLLIAKSLHLPLISHNKIKGRCIMSFSKYYRIVLKFRNKNSLIIDSKLIVKRVQTINQWYIWT